MNIKERTEINKNFISADESDFVPKMEINSEFDTGLIERINKGKNIIFVSLNEVSKIFQTEFFNSLFQKTNKNPIFNLNINASNLSDDEVVVYTKINFENFIEILKLNLTNRLSFVCFLKMGSFDNILETFKTLISINYPNLVQSNIEHLIALSNATLVFVKKNTDGNYSVSDICDVICQNGKISIDNKYLRTETEENNLFDNKKIKALKKYNILKENAKKKMHTNDLDVIE